MSGEHWQKLGQFRTRMAASGSLADVTFTHRRALFRRAAEPPTTDDMRAAERAWLVNS
jgi:hypothetical protein